DQLHDLDIEYSHEDFICKDLYSSGKDFIERDVNGQFTKFSEPSESLEHLFIWKDGNEMSNIDLEDSEQSSISYVWPNTGNSLPGYTTDGYDLIDNKSVLRAAFHDKELLQYLDGEVKEDQCIGKQKINDPENIKVSTWDTGFCDIELDVYDDTTCNGFDGGKDIDKKIYLGKVPLGGFHKDGSTEGTSVLGMG
ncbi:MAG: hypothetical protein GY816_14625, partial [Cytophagales bacterium]|nr:hypothetical protein [Cytophagales bacterium]